jgi:hypothetical protein
VRDGEWFVFVDWDEDEGRPVYIPHPRYTDPSFDGTGFGCKAHYPDDDPNQPMRFASKRWTETVENDRGRRETRRRMTVYYPDHVEKWTAASSQEDESGWKELIEEGEPWPIPWVDGGGKPLGIPLIHFYNPGRQSELWDAVPIQDLINKTALDIIAIADTMGFPIRITDWTPTTDGKPPESGGGNLLKLFPGAWIEMPKDGKVEVLPPADIAKAQESLDSWIVKLAQITDTPGSRLQLTRQVAAEGTLKQQEGPLLAKIRMRQTLFGNAWEDCLYMARRLQEFFGSGGVDEEGILSTEWAEAETRDEKEYREALRLEMAMGVPREMLWAKLGYDQDEIATMRAMVGEEMQQTANIGGALLEAFEGGGFGGGE